MSYDIELFRLKEGKTVEELNAFLRSDAYDEFIKLQDEKNDDEYETLPADFVDTSLSRDELISILGPAYLKADYSEQEITEDIRKYFKTGKLEDLSDDVADDVEMMFDYLGTPGIQPLCFTYAADLSECLALVTDMLKELQSQRIVAYDPQGNFVVDGETAAETFDEAAKNGKAMYEDLIRRIESGELFSAEDLESLVEEDEDSEIEYKFADEYEYLEDEDLEEDDSEKEKN